MPPPTPIRPLKREPVTAIREAAAPASASPARYNPGYLSLWPETALNYEECERSETVPFGWDWPPNAFEPRATAPDTPKGAEIWAALRLRLRVKRSP